MKTKIPKRSKRILEVSALTFTACFVLLLPLWLLSELVNDEVLFPILFDWILVLFTALFNAFLYTMWYFLIKPVLLYIRRRKRNAEGSLTDVSSHDTSLADPDVPILSSPGKLKTFRRTIKYTVVCTILLTIATSMMLLENHSDFWEFIYSISLLGFLVSLFVLLCMNFIVTIITPVLFYCRCKHTQKNENTVGGFDIEIKAPLACSEKESASLPKEYNVEIFLSDDTLAEPDSEENFPFPEPDPYIEPCPTSYCTTQNQFSAFGGIDADLLTIDLMDGHDFEHWCAKMLHNMGYSHIEETPESGDQGVDILAYKDGIKYAIQCKRYNSDLGNTPIQEVHAGKEFYHCDVSAVLTNQHFTKGAKALAEATRTRLWDREFITAYLTSEEHTMIPNYPHTIENLTKSDSSEPDYDDELFDEAVEVVIETGQASVSMLQRRLKIGYARAARLVDLLEERNIVGPFEGSKPRQVLLTREQWSELKYRNGVKRT